MGDALEMVRLTLRTRGLFELGQRRRLSRERADLGYLVHCCLRELFAEQAPQPFAIVAQRERSTEVLGYTVADADTLRAAAQRFADPALYSICVWPELHTKQMPVLWPAGTRLAFGVQACPVVRRSRGESGRKRGPEVDAFLAECLRVGDAQVVDRGAVYRTWLERELARGGAARLEWARLEGFARQRVLRREQGGPVRTQQSCERPNARLAGELSVADPAAFDVLLRRGLGRHRAFGFGMLLLRRPGNEDRTRGAAPPAAHGE